MKKLYFLILFLMVIGSSVFAQATKVVSTRQNYIRGTASSKYSDTTMVIITYDFDEKKVDFNYVVKKTPVYDDVKSLSLALAFVDKESNAPGIYAETLDKAIASVIFYDGWIEVHYRNGNLSVFNDVKPYKK